MKRATLLAASGRAAEQDPLSIEETAAVTRNKASASSVDLFARLPSMVGYALQMHVALVLPPEVAAELEVAGHAVVEPAVRGSAQDFAANAMVVLDAGATALAWAQAPQVFTYLKDALRAWLKREERTLTVKVTGSGFKGELTVSSRAVDPELDELMASLVKAWRLSGNFVAERE